jgi:MFS family permease
MSRSVADPRPTLDPRQRWVLAACCTVAFAKLVDPQAWMMGLDIPASAFGSAWADYRIFAGLNAVVLLAFLLLGGVLGDAFGRRRVLLLGAGGATLANVLALVAPNPPLFVVGRVLEAIGSALALPLSLALIRLTFPGRTLPLALLVYTFVTALGALASLLALVIDQFVGIRATLVLPIIAGSVGTGLAWRFVPESRASGGDRVRRAVAAAAWSLVLLVLAIGLIALRQTWPNPITLVAAVLSGLGAVALAFAGRGQLQAATRTHLTWRQRERLSIMLLAAAVLSLALTGYLMQLYSFFTVVEGLGTVVGGLALAPIILACVPVARLVARLSVQGESRRLIAGGLALIGLALLLTSLLQPGIAYLLLVVPMGLFGIGFLLAQTAWNNAFLSTLPADLVGVTAGISKAAAQTGTLLGSAVMGTILLQYGTADFARRLGDVGLSSAQIAGATALVDVVLRADLPLGSAPGSGTPSLDGPLMGTYYASYTVGLATTLQWAALACLLTAVLVWFALRGRREVAAVVASAARVEA